MLRKRVIELVGIAGNVGLVKAENLVEVVDPADKVVLNQGLNRVANIAMQLVDQPSLGEGAFQDRRANLDACLQIEAVQHCAALDRHC